MKNRLFLPLIFSLCFLTGFSQITVELKPHADDGKDAKVNELNLWDAGNSQEFIASTWTFGGIPAKVRSFIEFDLSAIPENSDIISATLHLYATQPMPSGNHSQLSGTNEAWLKRVIEDWNEEDILWETQPQASESGRIHIPASDSALQDYEIDVSDMVQNMVNNPETNHGFMIQLQLEEYYRRMNFASSDHPDSSAHPMLVVIYDCNLVDASFDYERDGLNVNFFNQSTNAFEYQWSFGDGGTSTEGNPSHTYQTQGYYEIQLIASNNCHADTITDSILVCPNVMADFYHTVDSTIASFRNLAQNADNFYWDFGDGTYSTELNPAHDYQNNGTYYACLTAANLCGIDIHCDSVVVCELPNTDFTANINMYEVYFTNLTDTAFSYYWEFGDGTTSTVKNPLHTYDTAGYYNVCLSAMNECGTEIYCDTIFVAPLPLSNFSFSFEDGSFHFNNLSQDVISCFWDFGDGITSTELHPLHIYENPGTYNVCLTIENEFGFYTSCDSLEVKEEMSIDELIVFPNPSNGLISINNTDQKELNLHIYYTNGQLVQSYRTSSSIPEIDISNLPKGLYIIRATTNKKIYKAKFLRR